MINDLTYFDGYHDDYVGSILIDEISPPPTIQS